MVWKQLNTMKDRSCRGHQKLC